MLADEVKVSTRAGLVALRDLLAETLLVAEPKEVAGLARQLQSVIGALDGLPQAKGADPVDEITARRRASRVGGAAEVG